MVADLDDGLVHVLRLAARRDFPPDEVGAGGVDVDGGPVVADSRAGGAFTITAAVSTIRFSEPTGRILNFTVDVRSTAIPPDVIVSVMLGFRLPVNHVRWLDKDHLGCRLVVCAAAGGAFVDAAAGCWLVEHECGRGAQVGAAVRGGLVEEHGDDHGCAFGDTGQAGADRDCSDLDGGERVGAGEGGPGGEVPVSTDVNESAPAVFVPADSAPVFS